MTEIIRRSSDEVKEAFYELGINDKLYNTWEGLKIFVIEFCSETGINSPRKYNNETWYEYCCRLSDWAKFKGCDQNDILRKIRSENIPRSMQIIVYSVGVTLENVIERLREIESFNEKKR